MPNGSWMNGSWMGGFASPVGHHWVLWLVLLTVIAIFTVALVRDWRKG